MNNLLSHEFSISPTLCDLSPFLLGMALGHRGLPGPHAARPAGSASRSGSDPAAIPLHATGAGSALDRAGRKGEGWPWCAQCCGCNVGSGGWEGRLRRLGSMHRAEAVPEPGRDAAVGVHGHSYREPVNIRPFRAALTPQQDPPDLHRYSCPTQRGGLLPRGRSCACCWHCRVYRHSYSVLIRPWSGSWVCAAFTASCTIPKSLLLVLILPKQFKAKYSLTHRFRLEFLQGIVSEKHLLSALNYENFTQNY